MHVTIVGFRGWLWRLKIALLLFRLGAWIAGIGIRIERTDDTRTKAETNG